MSRADACALVPDVVIDPALRYHVGRLTRRRLTRAQQGSAHARRDVVTAQRVMKCEAADESSAAEGSAGRRVASGESYADSFCRLVMRPTSPAPTRSRTAR